ncbi:hypothetical protein FHG87_009441 [Trinorchestia longiramus]|nr:hypothetical protein FHG87_009441 [Trinorchestia longiramus]
MMVSSMRRSWDVSMGDELRKSWGSMDKFSKPRKHHIEKEVPSSEGTSEMWCTSGENQWNARCVKEDSGMRYLVGLDEECNMTIVDVMKIS